MSFNREHLAKEAERLLNDDVLNYAISKISANTLIDLRDCDPGETLKIIQLQERAKLCEDFAKLLNRFVLEMGGDQLDEMPDRY